MRGDRTVVGSEVDCQAGKESHAHGGKAAWPHSQTHGPTSQPTHI